MRDSLGFGNRAEEFSFVVQLVRSVDTYGDEKMTLFTLLAITFFLFCLYSLLLPPRRFKNMGDKIPGPRAYPVIGNCLLFLKSDHFLRILIDMWRIYGPVVRLWLGKHLFIILSNPKDIEIFLASTKHMNKSDTYRLLDSWLGKKGLLTSDKDVWKVHRKLLTPSFHFKILESSLEIMQRNAVILCERLRCRVDGADFDMLRYTEKCSLDVISEAAMGVKLGTQESHNSGYLRSVKSITAMLVRRAASPWLYNDLLFRLSPLGKTYYKELEQIKTFVHRIIEKRKKTLQGARQSVIDENENRKEAKPFLDYMLLESNFTDEEIKDEVQTFMFAGHDTTMTTIAFCIYSLSRNPEVQAKLYREIQNFRDEKGGGQELSYNDYNQQRYLDNVIKETMRMYTTVPIISRKVSEDVTLPSGYTLPAGSLANIFLYQLHKDEKYFDYPEQFVPERFERKGNVTHFTFLPFSAGPRNCIGQKFAILEMKVIISALVQEYEFLPSREVRSLVVDTGIVLRSLSEIPVRVTLRRDAIQ